MTDEPVVYDGAWHESEQYECGCKLMQQEPKIIEDGTVKSSWNFVRACSEHKLPEAKGMS